MGGAPTHGCPAASGARDSSDNGVEVWLEWPDGHADRVPTARMLPYHHCLIKLVPFYESKTRAALSRRNQKGQATAAAPAAPVVATAAATANGGLGHGGTLPSGAACDGTTGAASQGAPPASSDNLGDTYPDGSGNDRSYDGGGSYSTSHRGSGSGNRCGSKISDNRCTSEGGCAPVSKRAPSQGEGQAQPQRRQPTCRKTVVQVTAPTPKGKSRHKLIHGRSTPASHLVASQPHHHP